MVRVVVVDDDTAILHLIADVLRLEGYAVRDAADGQVALAIVHAWRPDVVVTDLSMPWLDGAELIRRLRADPATRAIRIVVCSALVDRLDRAGLRVDARVAKPFDLADLLAAVAGEPDVAPAAPAGPCR